MHKVILIEGQPILLHYIACVRRDTCSSAFFLVLPRFGSVRFLPRFNVSKKYERACKLCNCGILCTMLCVSAVSGKPVNCFSSIWMDRWPTVSSPKVQST